jgi:hypothetical protein
MMVSKYAINLQVFSFTLLLILIIPASSAKNDDDLSKKKQSIDVQFDSKISAEKKEVLRQWITHSSNALKLVYGELPVDHFITKVKTSKRNSGAVPWGEVSRNTPPEVTLVVNAASTLNELKADWTIYHEFSHLLIPFDTGDARWFSEGLASYYQNIIQARAGMFSERKMWQKLYDGFERGRKETNYNHQKLSYLSDHIEINRNYMRIYWSGALYWFKADIALRKLNNNNSLDTALYQLRKCCFNRYLSAVEITKQLDQLTNSTIFTSLYKDFSNSYALPTFIEELRSLGINEHAGKIELKNEAKYLDIRRAIFQGKLE